MADKWTQAQAEATARYEEKTYKNHMFKLRLEEDADILDSIEEAIEHGIPKREWLSAIFHYGGKPKEVVPEGLVSINTVEEVLSALRVDGADIIIEELNKRAK